MSQSHPFIRVAGSRFRVRVPHPGNSDKREGGYRGTLAEAIALRNAILLRLNHPDLHTLVPPPTSTLLAKLYPRSTLAPCLDTVTLLPPTLDDALALEPVIDTPADSLVISPALLPADTPTPLVPFSALSSDPALTTDLPTPTTYDTTPFSHDLALTPFARPTDPLPVNTPHSEMTIEKALANSLHEELRNKHASELWIRHISSEQNVFRSELTEQYKDVLHALGQRTYATDPINERGKVGWRTSHILPTYSSDVVAKLGVITKEQARQNVGTTDPAPSPQPSEKKFSEKNTTPTIAVPTLTAPPLPQEEDLWERVIGHQARAKAEQHHRDHRTISLPNEPIAIAFTSDTHFGNPNCDYLSAKRDAELIRDTEGMYAMFVGDGIDNWGAQAKLLHLQRTQPVTYPQEVQLLDEYMKLLADKMLVIVSGNHELWTFKSAGIDLLRHCLRVKPLIYEPFHAAFSLKWGATSEHHLRFLVRHKWKGNSIFNPTHAQEVSWERIGEDYDVGIGGHTHIGTLFREFLRQHKKRLAILVGTYKVHDKFGEEIGFAKPYGVGCGAIVLHPDGRWVPMYDLATARDFLAHWRASFFAKAN